MGLRFHIDRFPSYSIKSWFKPVPQWYQEFTRRRIRRKQKHVESTSEHRAFERQRKGDVDWWY